MSVLRAVLNSVDRLVNRLSPYDPTVAAGVGEALLLRGEEEQEVWPGEDRQDPGVDGSAANPPLAAEAPTSPTSELLTSGVIAIELWLRGVPVHELTVEQWHREMAEMKDRAALHRAEGD